VKGEKGVNVVARIENILICVGMVILAYGVFTLLSWSLGLPLSLLVIAFAIGLIAAAASGIKEEGRGNPEKAKRARLWTLILLAISLLLFLVKVILDAWERELQAEARIFGWYWPGGISRFYVRPALIISSVSTILLFIYWQTQKTEA